MATKNKTTRNQGFSAKVFGLVIIILWGAIFVFVLSGGFISIIGKYSVGTILVILLLDYLGRAWKIMQCAKVCWLIKRLALGVVIYHALLIFWPFGGPWEPYKFDKKLSTIHRSYADPQNAALIYEPIFSQINLEEITQKKNEDLLCLATKGPWQAEDNPDIKAWFSKYIDIMIELDMALSQKKCYFPIGTEPFADISDEVSSRHGKLNFCADLLLAAGNKERGEGRAETAIKRYLASVQVAKQCYQQPTIIDFLHGHCIESKALNLVFDTVMEDGLSTKEIQMISRAIDTDNHWQKDWSVIFIVEKVRAKNMFAGLYETNNKGKTRFSEHLFPSDHDEYPGWDKAFRKSLSAFASPLFFPYRPETAGEAIDKAYECYQWVVTEGYDEEQCEERAKKELCELGLLRGFMSGGLAISSLRLHDIHTETVSRRRVCHLLIGLWQYKRMYGKWPENLEAIRPLVADEALVDAVNGEVFIYKLVGEDFSLYSSGKNRIDEGGKAECDIDDIVFWPVNRCECDA